MSLGMAAEPGRISFGWVVSTTFSLVQRRFVEIAGLALLLVALPQLVAGLLPQGGGLVASIPGLVFDGAVAVIAQQDLTNGGASVAATAAMGQAWRRVGVLFGVAILSGLAVVGGLLLLLVPGFFLMVAWLPAGPVAMLENLGVTQSLGRAWRLTEGHRWILAGLCGVYLAAWCVLLLVLILLANAASTAGSTASSILVAIFSAIAATIGGLFGASGAAVSYLALREAHDGPTTDVAAVFA